VIYSYTKTKRYALIFHIYFSIRTLHVSDSFCVHHQESSTVHTAILTRLCSLLASNVYDVYISLCVQCQTPDDGQRNCPKHVES